MRKIIIALLCCLSLSSLAQEAQKEINDQVWKVFIEGFNNADAEKFMSVHSKDVVRSSRDANSILGWNEYHDQTIKGNQRAKETSVKLNIELRFLQRIAKDGLAMDIGIYKTTVIRNDQPRVQYGKFLVTLRRENGVWKILVDTDSSEGGKIAEKDFLEAKPME